MTLAEKLTALENAQAAVEAAQAAVTAATTAMVTRSGTDPNDEAIDIGTVFNHPSHPIAYTKIGADLVVLKRVG